ncbi:MAG: class I SAM-dependent DNA methyltransferase [Dehalococcoidales bacterium]
MKNYQRLAQFYEVGGWGKFAEHYIGLIDRLLIEYGIKKARILDIACGTGILALALAKQGHSVHGIDISQEMIALARAKSSGIANVSFDVQSITDFKVKGEFDIVTCTFDSLNYLITFDELKKMFDCVAGSLGKSGLFVFDSNTSQQYLSVGNISLNQTIGAESFQQEVSYDPVRKKAKTIFKFADGAEEIHEQRPYELSDLNPILNNSGLRLIKSFSWFDDRPYNKESKRLICITQRNF